jgi:RNA-directed DNA polymerase
LDQRLADLSQNKAVRYTRYADDLFFSTNEPNVLNGIAATVPDILRSLHYPKHLQINSAKTRHSSKSMRRSITGLIITDDGRVSIGREIKRRLRSQVHNLSRLNDAQRNQLQGWLAHCQSVEPEYINRLNLKFGSKRVLEARRGNLHKSQ